MITVLCYGDSNTYGYIPGGGRYPKRIRWPGRLAELLGNDYYVIEEGCCGRTTVYDPEESWKNGMRYLKPCLSSHIPVDILILMLGTNDLQTCFSFTEPGIACGVRCLIDIIMPFLFERQGFVPEIFLVAPPEIGEGITDSEFAAFFDSTSVSRSRLFGPSYADVAAEKACHFWNAAQWVRPSPVDCLHLDEAGHAVVAEQVAQQILALEKTISGR